MAKNMRELLRPNLSELTTIRLGGQALALLEPEDRNEIAELENRAKKFGAPLYPIGRGSNLLASDGDLPIVLASLNRLTKLEIISREEDKALVYAEAGVPLPRLLRFCLANGLSGLEGLAGIPGHVGGACAMNAGSFGATIADNISELEIWDGQNFVKINKDDLQASYRRLLIKGYAKLPLVAAAIFILTFSSKGAIFGRMNLNYLHKKSRQPIHAWSAGCAFKNPSSELSAGKLLEECGFRGKKLGAMCFSQKHANFLVNEGKGDSSQAFELLHLAKEAVSVKTGIELEAEIRFIPCRAL